MLGCTPHRSSDSINHFESQKMISHLKNAAMTTGIVLATLYVLNMFAPTKNIVKKALGN